MHIARRSSRGCCSAPRTARNPAWKPCFPHIGPDRYGRLFRKNRSMVRYGKTPADRASGRDAPAHPPDHFEYAIEAAVLGHNLDRRAVLQYRERMLHPIDRVVSSE